MGDMTTTTVTRVPTGKAGEAKSHKLQYVFPDGTTTTNGGKIAARATHAVVVRNREAVEGDSEWVVERAGRWGVWAENGRLDLAQRSADQARRCDFATVTVVPVLEG